jgi:hypothetical protein
MDYPSVINALIREYFSKFKDKFGIVDNHYYS